MKHGRNALDDYADVALDTRAERAPDAEPVVGRERTRIGLAGAALGVGVAGAAVLGTARAALADNATDVQALQTAASIENLAVSTYTTALSLPYIGGSAANAVVKAFSEKTLAQHKEHGQAL